MINIPHNAVIVLYVKDVQNTISFPLSVLAAAYFCSGLWSCARFVSERYKKV